MARERTKEKSNTVLFLYPDTLYIIKDTSQLVGIKQLKDHYLKHLIKMVFK